MLAQSGRRITQIPSGALEAILRGAVDATDRRAPLVVNHEIELGLGLFGFLTQLVTRRVGKRLAFLRRLFLRVLPLLFLSLQLVFQERRKDCAIRRIVRGVKRISLKSFFRSAQRVSLDI